MQAKVKLRVDYPIEKIVSTLIPKDPRTDPKNPAIKELAESIRHLGVLQPILLSEAGEVLAGRRRLAAANLAGLEEIPARIIEVTAQEAAEIQVVENLQREDLTPLEESHDVRRLLDSGWKVEDIAAHIGKSPTWVVRRGNLTNLSKEWRKALSDPKHSEHGRVSLWPAGWLELVSRCSEEKQAHVLVEAWDIDNREKLERMTAGGELLISKAPWKKDDGTLVPEAGSCNECTKRSSHRPGLFDDWGLEPTELKKTDKCLDPACWKKKAAVHIERREAELKEKHGDVIRVKENYYSGPKDAVFEHSVNKLKSKKAKDAKPCIMINGPKAGQVFYGQLQSWARPSQGGPATPGRKKGTPSSLKERKTKLAKRREALVNEWLRKKLKDKDYPKMAVGRYGVESLLRHLVAFGTDCSFGNPWTGKILKMEECEEKLWASVFQVMESRLHYYADPPAKEHEQLCKYHGDLFNVTIEGLRAQAAKEIPEPKNWANLNADGTPKKSKAAKKAPRKKAGKKKAGKKKASKKKGA